MEYNKIIINNNLLHYSSKANNHIPSNNISKNIRKNNKENLKTNQLLLNYNYNKHYSNINNHNQNFENDIIPFSSRGNYKIKNDIYSLGNIEQKRVNKTPQARIKNKTNFDFGGINNNNLNRERIIKNDNFDFYDIRVDYCLEMLNLNEIKNIFHNKNIGFNEFLYISEKDMEKMRIPKYSQLIIKKFTIDYINRASKYTAEELEKFFQIYYRNNISKIMSNKKMQRDFPIRSFSPIAYNTKSLLNKYNYNLFNINDIHNSNEKRNTYNIYDKVNNANNYINNDYPTNLNQRNCLSASQRRKNPASNRKKNINKNIRYSKSSNIYSNNKRFRNISSSDSQNFLDVNNPIHKTGHININNYFPNEKYHYEKIKNTHLNNDNIIILRNNSYHTNDINNKLTKVNRNIENYLDMIKHKKIEGNFDSLNIAINNFYRENMKKNKIKSNIQKKMNQLNLNNNINNIVLLKKLQLNHENQENKYFNSYENAINQNNNYFDKINFSGIQQNHNYNDSTYSPKNNILLNSNNITSNYDNYYKNQREDKNKSTSNGGNKRQHYKNSIINNYNNFINNKNKNRNKAHSNKYKANNNKKERKIITTSIIYKNNYNKDINNNSNYLKNIISLSGNSVNLIKNNNRANNPNKMNINNKSNNINNQNLIINERNNLNIYYNASKLINNNIINYDKISSSSDYLFSNQHIPNSNKVKGKNNNIENNKLKEIIKNVNNNINKNKKENIISLTNNKIKSNINNITKNIKNIKQMNPKEKNINKNINYKSIPNKKSNNNLYKKFPKNNNIINKKGNQNLNKRSSSQINNKFNQHINKYNNGEYIYSDKRNINNIGKYKNDLNCGRNHYMKNKNETEDSDYYINYL